MMSNRACSKGFTLIELMISMTFLSILLIAITVATLQIMHQYSKGMTVKSINQIGRNLADSIRRDARSLSTVGGGKYVAPNTVGAGGLGRLCLGSASYIWNTDSALRDGTGVKYTGVPSPRMIAMARVNDQGGQYCLPVSGNYRMDVPATLATEMLSNSLDTTTATTGTFTELALYEMTLTPMVTNNPGVLYTLQFTLGTNQSGTIDTVDQSCLNQSNTTSNYDFCAVNKFQIVLRMG